MAMASIARLNYWRVYYPYVGWWSYNRYPLFTIIGIDRHYYCKNYGTILMHYILIDRHMVYPVSDRHIQFLCSQQVVQRMLVLHRTAS